MDIHNESDTNSHELHLSITSSSSFLLVIRSDKYSIFICYAKSIFLMSSPFLHASLLNNVNIWLSILDFFKNFLIQVRHFVTWLEVLTMLPQRYYKSIMDQNQMYGVQEWYYTYYLVAFPLFGQVSLLLGLITIEIVVKKKILYKLSKNILAISHS